MSGRAARQAVADPRNQTHQNRPLVDFPEGSTPCLAPREVGLPRDDPPHQHKVATLATLATLATPVTPVTLATLTTLTATIDAVTDPHADAVTAELDPQATHLDVERLLLVAGWTPCGAGDWAIALASPDGDVVARISPFDPVGPYTARLYDEAAATGLVPLLFAHRRLAGGGDLQLLERLTPVGEPEAFAFLARLADPDPGIAALADIVASVHADAVRELPWCGPLDSNPSNIMRNRHGRLVLTDPYYADGPNLYATAEQDPARLVTLIPEEQRRFMTEIPLAESGPWSTMDRLALQEKLRRADATPS